MKHRQTQARLDAFLIFRVPFALKAALLADAEKEGLELSEFCRRRLTKNENVFFNPTA